GTPDVYTTQLVLTLEGPLDQEALQSAAQDVLSRHKSLRASFHHEGLEQPVQVVQSAIETPWRTVDLSRVEDSAREHRLAEIFDTDRARRFDLASAPLVRFTLIRLSDGEHRLILTHHHILMDGWSAPIVVGELLSLYGSRGKHAAPAGAAQY